MRAFLTAVFVTSLPLFASCQSSGIKGTIIVRRHCGTPVGTPSLWIAPTHYVSNVTAHIATEPVGGTSQDTANSQQGNNGAQVSSARSSTANDVTKTAGPTSPSISKNNQSPVSNGINQPTQTLNAASQSSQESNPGNTASQRPLAALTTNTQSSCITATATPISCPASDGTTYTPAGSCIGGQDSYVIDCGMEYSGSGFTTLTGIDSTEQCIDSCNSDASCMAVAFDTASGMCYERSSVVFGNATAVPNLIFAFNARYVAAGGVYPSSGVEAVPTGLTKTLSSTSSNSNLPGDVTAAQAASFSPAQTSAISNSALPSANVATLQLSGRSSSLISIALGQSNTIATVSSGLPASSDGAVSLLNQTTTTELHSQQSSITSAAASQQSSLASASAMDTGPPSTTPTIPVSQACPQDSDHNIMVPEGTSWFVSCAQLYIGKLVDMGTNATSPLTADDCLASCDELGSGCVGFTYTDPTCMMYSRIDGVRSAAVNIVSARRYILGSFSSALTTFSTSAEPAVSSTQGPSQAQSTAGVNSNSLSTTGTSGLGVGNGLTSAFSSLSTLPSSIGRSSVAVSPGTSASNSLASFSTSSTISSPSATAPNPSLSSGVLPPISTVQTRSTSFNSVSTASSLTTISAQLPVISSVSTTTQSVSAASPTQAAPCPSANGQTYTDQSETQYVIMCSTNTSPGNFAATIGIDFDSCVENCGRQTEQACVAVTYTNDTCFYKAQYENSYPVGNVQAAVRLNLVTGTTSTAFASSTAQSLGVSGSLTALTSFTSLGSSLTSIPNSISSSSLSITSSMPSATSLSVASTTNSNGAILNTLASSNSISYSVVASLSGTALSASTQIASVTTSGPLSDTLSTSDNPETNSGPTESGALPSTSADSSNPFGTSALSMPTSLASGSASTQSTVGETFSITSGLSVTPGTMLPTAVSSSGAFISSTSTSTSSLTQINPVASTQTTTGATNTISIQTSIPSNSIPSSYSSSSGGLSLLGIGGPSSVSPSGAIGTSLSSTVSQTSSPSDVQSSSGRGEQSPTILTTDINSSPLTSTSTPLSTASPTISADTASSAPASSIGGTLASTTSTSSGGSVPPSISSSVIGPPAKASTDVSFTTNTNAVASGNQDSVSSTLTSSSPSGAVLTSPTVSSVAGNPGSSFSGSQSSSMPYNQTAVVTDSLLSTTDSAYITSISSSVVNSGLSNSSVPMGTSQSTSTVTIQSVSTGTSQSVSSVTGQSVLTATSPSVSTIMSSSASSSPSSTVSFASTTLSSSSSTQTTCAAVLTAPSCPGGNQTIYPALDGSRFRLDCGIDYPGLDVDAYAAVDLDTCFQMCEARGPSCAGVSFVPSFLTSLLSGYTCYFKSSINAAAAIQQTYQTNSLVRLSIGSMLASAAAPVCPGANGQDYVGADGSRFRIHCNTDYLNNGLIQANASSFQVCIDSCDRAGILCAGVSYTPAGNRISPQPVCYLKSAIGLGVNAVLGLVGGVIGSENYDVHSAVRIGNPIFNNPPAYTCSAR